MGFFDSRNPKKKEQKNKRENRNKERFVKKILTQCAFDVLLSKQIVAVDSIRTHCD